MSQTVCFCTRSEGRQSALWVSFPRCCAALHGNCKRQFRPAWPFTVRIEGKALPLAGTVLPAPPLLRGDPRNAPVRVSVWAGFAVTG